MSSKFSLQSPYVVASLPRPIDHKKGRYVVGDVYGGAPGAKKRKRPELAVGIDGEGLNLYNISSSRLITSYALPPQSSFTCPPTSLRNRISKNQVERRTYASTAGVQSQISLFHDVTDGSTPTKSSTKSHILENARNPVIFIGVIAPTFGTDLSNTSSDLLVLRKDGEIECIDGDTLQQKWISPPIALAEAPESHNKEIEVEYAHLTNAYAASQSILKGRQDVFAMFAKEISEDGFNPDILIIVTKAPESLTRTLHIITPPRRSSAHTNGLQHSVQVLLAAPFPDRYKQKDKTTFSMQTSAGILQQLTNNTVTTFDLTYSGPKEQSSLLLDRPESFLRLSSTSIMVASERSITVYNPKYQSILATIELDGASKKESLKRKRKSDSDTNGALISSCSLVTYFPKLSTAVAIRDNSLIAIQVEGHQDRHGKPRAAGLLIDSLGCSVKEQIRPGQEIGKRGLDQVGSTTMHTYLPSSMTECEGLWADHTKILEEAFSVEDTLNFDALIAPKLHISNADPDPAKPLMNGVKKSTKDSSNVDRRWIIYALSKIFSIAEDDSGESRLSISFYPPNTFWWLTNSGYMTVANIEAALKAGTGVSSSKSIPAGDLVNTIVELNPDMEILLALLGNNYLGATELIHAIRKLMESFGIIGEHIRAKQGLLTNGKESELVNGDLDQQVEKLRAEAEKDLESADYLLGAGSGIRAQALSLALSKLYTCPSSAIVNALQTTLTSQEIIRLIEVLRFELLKGAWTFTYLDKDELGLIDFDTETPASAIMLISSILNNCIDAVGAGGWLSGDLKLVTTDPFEAKELIVGLKNEVSAALEGIQAAAYLKGLTSEMVRFGDAVQKSLPQEVDPDLETPAKEKKKAPVLLPSLEAESKSLPLGLKAEQQISRLKVGAGGEVYRRTRRDIGHLKSQKVGKYSLERIVI